METTTLTKVLEHECKQFIAYLLDKYAFVESVHVSAYATPALVRFQDVRKGTDLNKFAQVVFSHNEGVIVQSEEAIQNLRNRLSDLFQQRMDMEQSMLNEVEKIYELLVNPEVEPSVALAEIKRVRALFNEYKPNTKSASNPV